jgi:signal transduction histidine kinase
VALKWFQLGRLQRKVLMVVSAIVIVPMLVAGWLASEWVSTSFEQRLEQWIVDAARANQNWLEAYQNDAIMLGRVLADDPGYARRLARSPEDAIQPAVRRIAQELGINLVQVYTPEQKLLYTSIPLEMETLWEPGQTEAVLKVTRKKKVMLAAIGITAVPRRGEPRYYLVLGSLLGQEFTKELGRLTGLTARLYYREGKKYIDAFAEPAVVLPKLPAVAMRVLEQDKKPYYLLRAEEGQFRGVYTPLVDATGHVEAIMFSGLERRGFQEVLTNRLTMFLLISLLGVVIGVLMGLFLSRLVIRPVEYLRNGVLQLAGQNFDAQVPIQSHDEVGDLAKAFNAMAARLRAARDEQAQQYRKDKLSALGELSASLAHEIRNPIGVINTSAALLDKAEDPQRHAELTRMIREESQRVSGLVQDFLQLSRHRQPAFAPINPIEPLERAVGLALAGRPNVHVHKAFTHGAATINADAGLLAQAWGNILTNALQAMGEDGELWLESRVEGSEVCVSVEDSGPGIAADILPRLFEPFFTTKDHGTGLGLTIAFTLVEANGGRIEARPAEQRGARFGMRFPLRDKGNT